MDALDTKNLALLKRTWAISMVGQHAARFGGFDYFFDQASISKWLRAMRKHNP